MNPPVVQETSWKFTQSVCLKMGYHGIFPKKPSTNIENHDQPRDLGAFSWYTPR